MTPATPATSRLPYLVGEYEPELFVPDRSGYVHAPSHMVQTGGGNTTNNITIERVELPGVRDEEEFIEAI